LNFVLATDSSTAQYISHTHTTTGSTDVLGMYFNVQVFHISSLKVIANRICQKCKKNRPIWPKIQIRRPL